MEEDTIQLMLGRRMEQTYSNFTDDDMGIVIMHIEFTDSGNNTFGGKENE